MSSAACYAGGHRCVTQLSERSLKVLTLPDPHIFTFDAVAGEQSTQQQIFNGTYIRRYLSAARAFCSAFIIPTMTLLTDRCLCMQWLAGLLWRMLFQAIIHAFLHMDRLVGTLAFSQQDKAACME